MTRSRTLAFVAVAAIIAASAIAFLSIRTTGTSLDVSGWRTYGGDREGWTIRYPPQWRVQPFTDCEFLGYQNALVVTSTDFVFDGPHEGRDECYGRFFLAGFPSGGVALALQPYGFRPGLFDPCVGQRTRLPIDPDDLERTSAIRGGPRVRFQAVCIGDMPVYMVRTWTGRTASDRDIRALELVLGSIRFLRDPT